MLLKRHGFVDFGDPAFMVVAAVGHPNVLVCADIAAGEDAADRFPIRFVVFPFVEILADDRLRTDF